MGTATIHGLTASGLATRLGVTKRAAQQRLERLAAWGYLEDQGVTYWLTPAGEVALDQVRSALQEAR